MAAADATQPSHKEAIFFLNIIGNMKNKPDVDWEKVAELSGYSNATCAKTRFGQVKKRLGYTTGGSPSSSPAGKKEKIGGANTKGSKVAKTPTKKRTKKEVTVEEEVMDSVEEDEAEDSNHVGEYEEDENGYYDIEEGVAYYDSAENQEV